MNKVEKYNFEIFLSSYDLLKAFDIRSEIVLCRKTMNTYLFWIDLKGIFYSPAIPNDSVRNNLKMYTATQKPRLISKFK